METVTVSIVHFFKRRFTVKICVFDVGRDWMDNQIPKVCMEDVR